MFKVSTVSKSPNRRADESDPHHSPAVRPFHSPTVGYALAGLSTLLCCFSIGCSGWGSGNGLGLGLRDTLLIEYRDAVWARRAYNLRYGNCDRPFSRHYRDGFCEGYCNVCNGGDGYVPALPPAEYRGYEYQSAEGAQCVNAWFEGYPAGVAAAKKDRAGDFKEMFVSRMINSAVTQDKAKHQLPDDVPLIAPDKQPEDQDASVEDRVPPAPELPAAPVIRGKSVSQLNSPPQLNKPFVDVQSDDNSPVSVFEPYGAKQTAASGNTPMPVSVNQPPIIRQASEVSGHSGTWR